MALVVPLVEHSAVEQVEPSCAPVLAQSVVVLQEVLQEPKGAHSPARASVRQLVLSAEQHGSTSLANQTNINLLAQRLLLSIRQGDAEDFIDSLEGNAYDFDTVCQALAKCLNESSPNDWQNAATWLGAVRAVISGYIGEETLDEGAFLSIMRRWKQDPEWQSQEFAPLRDFAQDELYRRGSS